MPSVNKNPTIYSRLPLDPDAIKPGSYKWPPHFAPSLQVVVFIGGGFGTLARYAVGILLPTSGSDWPVATFIVNLLGAFLLGIVLELVVRSGPHKGLLRVIRLGIGTGFIGGFTTYSTFAIEVDLLYKANEFTLALSYAIASVVGGVLLSALGIFIAAHQYKRQRGVVS